LFLVSQSACLPDCLPTVAQCAVPAVCLWAVSRVWQGCAYSVVCLAEKAESSLAWAVALLSHLSAQGMSGNDLCRQCGGGWNVRGCCMCLHKGPCGEEGLLLEDGCGNLLGFCFQCVSRTYVYTHTSKVCVWLWVNPLCPL
jgi:hypothetical protein